MLRIGLFIESDHSLIPILTDDIMRHWSRYYSKYLSWCLWFSFLFDRNFLLNDDLSLCSCLFRKNHLYSIFQSLHVFPCIIRLLKFIEKPFRRLFFCFRPLSIASTEYTIFRLGHKTDFLTSVLSLH